MDIAFYSFSLYLPTTHTNTFPPRTAVATAANLNIIARLDPKAVSLTFAGLGKA